MSRRAAAVAAAAVAVLAAGCSGSGSGPSAAPSARSSVPSSAASVTPPTPSASSTSAPRTGVAAGAWPSRLPAERLRWRLPQPLSRMATAVVGSRLLLVGGLDAAGSSTSRVTALDPRTGRATRYGALRMPVHDTAAVLLRGRLTVFGGGGATESSAVQQLPPGGGRARVVGRLPEPRSDLSAVTVGGTAYVVGGYTGVREVPTVLATTDGRRFRTVARLPVTVRYAAVAALGTDIWVIGGEHHHRFLSLVQRIDVRTGQARVVGHLPRPRGEATAVPVGGRLLLLGGRDAGGATSVVLAGTVAHGRLRWRRVATLPVPTADAGVALLGQRVDVLGGETPSRVDVTQAVRVPAS